MRIALLSLIGRLDDGKGESVANTCLAGITIAQRQLDLALSLGCERIICLMRPGEDPPSSLAHAMASEDRKISAISEARGLLGLVGSSDELLVIADGLVAANSTAAAELGKGNGVLGFPVDAGIAKGFERIDLNYAWAGILMMPGSLVERLTQLPPDCDTISSLLRIALQGQVPIRNLPETLLEEGRWALIQDEGDFTEFESQWFSQHLASPRKFAPGRALAAAILRRIVPRVIDAKLRPRLLLVVGSLLALAGVAAAFYGYGAIAMAACGTGWLLSLMGRALGRMLQSGLTVGKGDDRTANYVAGWIDLCFLASLALSVTGTALDRLFPAFSLLALLYLSAEVVSDKWRELTQDRLVLAIVLTAAAMLSLLLQMIQFLSIVLLLVLLRQIRGRSRLTGA